MPDHVRRGNATKSIVRARVEHVFAQQLAKMTLLIRTIGIKRAEAKITLANLTYNTNRLIFHERREEMGKVGPEISTSAKEQANIPAKSGILAINPPCYSQHAQITR